LNGLKTKPGLPGTGFATGNWDATADGVVLLATGFGVADDRWVNFRDATRGVGDATGNGLPGWVTSVLGAGVGSGELKT
jgi:hypothetical protein